ncbi:MAG: hypothetical protein ACI4L7_02735 [Christensenellales bacterium]
MKKFWTVLLRVTMIVSLIGILAFAGVAIVKNRNIAYEAYGYITTGIEHRDFEQSFDNFRTNVFFRYSGTDDRYMLLVNKAVSSALDGCKYYLDYMSVLPDISKGEQDKAEKNFDDFISSYEKTLTDYDIYREAYKNAVAESGSATAITIVESKEGNLVYSYINCYNQMTKLLMSLRDIVSKYAFEGNLTYEAQAPIITAGLAQKAINDVFRGNSRSDWLDIYASTNQNIADFEKFLQKSKDYSSSMEVANTDFKNFVNNLNSLDIYSWAKDYEGYTDSLVGEKKTKSQSAYSYFTNNIMA